MSLVKRAYIWIRLGQTRTAEAGPLPGGVDVVSSIGSRIHVWNRPVEKTRLVFLSGRLRLRLLRHGLKVGKSLPICTLEKKKHEKAVQWNIKY